MAATLVTLLTPMAAASMSWSRAAGGHGATALLELLARPAAALVVAADLGRVAAHRLLRDNIAVYEEPGAVDAPELGFLVMLVVDTVELVAGDELDHAVV